MAQAAQVSVSNDQVLPLQLPLTGSSVTTPFIGAGLVLVVGDVLLATDRKRREQRGSIPPLSQKGASPINSTVRGGTFQPMT
ncbi:LPXTG cell wall anchor domain-containing protein [Glutamicibacter sp. AGC13]